MERKVVASLVKMLETAVYVMSVIALNVIGMTLKRNAHILDILNLVGRLKMGLLDGV